MQHTDFDNLGPVQLFDATAIAKRLWQRRRMVLLITAGVLLLAVFYLLLTRPSYTASASILVDPRDIKTTNIDTVLPGIGADSAAIASQVSVIQSRDLLGKVFDQLHLADDPEYSSHGVASDLLDALRPSPAPGVEALFQKFASTVAVEREGLTYVIDVSVKSTDADKAARIANAIVDNYIEGTAAQQRTATSEVTDALNRKIASLQADVNTAELAVEDFKQKNGIFDAASGGTLSSQVDALSGQLLSAQDAVAQAETKYDQAVAAGTSPEALLQLSAIWSSPTMESLRADYNNRAATLASAQATLGPKHPTIVQAKAELARVETLLVREAKRISAELKSDRDLARANLDKVQAALDSARAASSKSGMAEVTLRQLQRQADAARTVLDDFMQRSQETSQIEGLQNQQVHVISKAVAPADPAWPKPLLLLPVSAVLGLMLGSAVALLMAEGTGPAPRPSPGPTRVVPTEPARDRRRPSRPAPEAESVARRLAGLDLARSDLMARPDTQVSRAIRKLLRNLIQSLPLTGGPYILAFFSEESVDLGGAGASLTEIGLNQIGGRALLLNDGISGDRADDCNFILVAASHPLALHADCLIEVVTPARAAYMPDRSRLVLVLDLDQFGPDPHRTFGDARPPIRAAL